MSFLTIFNENMKTQNGTRLGAIVTSYKDIEQPLEWKLLPTLVFISSYILLALLDLT